MEISNKEINNFRHYCRVNGFDFRSLSDKTLIHSKRLESFADGNDCPSKVELEKICLVFHVTSNDLFAKPIDSQSIKKVKIIKPIKQKSKSKNFIHTSKNPIKCKKELCFKKNEHNVIEACNFLEKNGNFSYKEIAEEITKKHSYIHFETVRQTILGSLLELENGIKIWTLGWYPSSHGISKFDPTAEELQAWERAKIISSPMRVFSLDEKIVMINEACDYLANKSSKPLNLVNVCHELLKKGLKLCSTPLSDIMKNNHTCLWAISTDKHKRIVKKEIQNFTRTDFVIPEPKTINTLPCKVELINAEEQKNYSRKLNVEKIQKMQKRLDNTNIGSNRNIQSFCKCWSLNPKDLRRYIRSGHIVGYTCDRNVISRIRATEEITVKIEKAQPILNHVQKVDLSSGILPIVTEIPKIIKDNNQEKKLEISNQDILFRMFSELVSSKLEFKETVLLSEIAPGLMTEEYKKEKISLMSGLFCDGSIVRKASDEEIDSYDIFQTINKLQNALGNKIKFAEMAKVHKCTISAIQRSVEKLHSNKIKAFGEFLEVN